MGLVEPLKYKKEAKEEIKRLTPEEYIKKIDEECHYINFTKEKIQRTVDLTGAWVHLDLDNDNRPVGLEIIGKDFDGNLITFIRSLV